MLIKKLFENWDLSKLKIRAGFVEMDWEPNEIEKEAAWELYVEMLTRIVTQPLPQAHGDEQTALASVHSLFGITREILRAKGRECVQFTKIAIIVLNQIVRPFTAKWHKLSLEGAFSDEARCAEFRRELDVLREDLLNYARILADIADVEDLTDFVG